MSIKTKLVLVFLLISLVPLTLTGVAGYYHITKISQLALVQTRESLKKLGEAMVEQKAADIVKTVQIVIKHIREYHQEGETFNWEDLRYDPLFMTAAVQTVGKTGYSGMVMKKGKKIITFLHPNPKLIGVDLAPIAKKNKEFWRIIQEPKPGERFSKGYYDWKEPDGHIERKFMVVMPVPNTPLMVVATLYTKEIEAPLKDLKATFEEPRKKFLLQYEIGGLATAIVVFIIAILFALRLSRPIIHLTEVAEKISLGELGVPIEITSTDEIGDLADALRRMQASLRKAIQRLQRRHLRRRGY